MISTTFLPPLDVVSTRSRSAVVSVANVSVAVTSVISIDDRDQLLVNYEQILDGTIIASIKVMINHNRGMHIYYYSHAIG